jgi:predicted dehydrogenase
VFCEKPLAPTMVDVMAMTDAVQRAGVVHQVGLVMRAMAPLVQLHRLATSAGAIGRPMAAVFRDDQYFPIQGRYASMWRADVGMAGGGTLIEHSIHDLDVLAWVLGDVREVTCRTANYAGHPGIEDVAAATLVHASGATSTLVSIWHQVMSRPSIRRIEIFCERAMLWLDDQDAGPVHVETDGGDHLVETETAAGLVPYAAADRAFLEAVATGRPAQPGFEVAVAAHRIADACYRSAALGGSPTAVALL